MIGRIAIAGAGVLVLKALKKHPDSEGLSTHAFHLLYLLSCEPTHVQRLVSHDLLDALSTTLEVRIRPLCSPSIAHIDPYMAPM